ncbi:DUF2225 domain-containing protein, partial [Fibrobacterota bacterium]
LGADYLLTKPLDFDSVFNLLKKWETETPVQANLKPELDEYGKKLPFSTINMSCYICGYESVKMHVPIQGAFEENWDQGLYPVYKSLEEYEEWDFLRSMVAVCPYCYFASSSYEDFSDTPGNPFPYKPDAKRILSRTISGRKKILSGIDGVDKRFDSPHRDQDLVISSLRLAEKCMNGLILGEKQGTHFQLGYYCVLLGCLDKSKQDSYFQSALENFNNQLRYKTASNTDIIKSHFFCMVLNMALGQSAKAKEIIQSVTIMYSEKTTGEANEEEKTWLKRISRVWELGVDADMVKKIEG